jgi:hypothetical protein
MVTQLGFWQAELFINNEDTGFFFPLKTGSAIVIGKYTLGLDPEKQDFSYIRMV